MAPPKTRTVIKELKTKCLMKKVYNFFKLEANMKRNWNLSNPLKRLSRATGLSERCILAYLEEDDPVHMVVKSVHKDNKKKQVSVNKKMNDCDEEVVRRTIYTMFEKKEDVTMKKLHGVLKESGIDVSLSTVVRTVKRLGFSYFKDESGKQYLSEIIHIKVENG